MNRDADDSPSSDAPDLRRDLQRAEWRLEGARRQLELRLRQLQNERANSARQLARSERELADIRAQLEMVTRDRDALVDSRTFRYTRRFRDLWGQVLSRTRRAERPEGNTM